MHYLYKIYDYKEERYNKYVIMEERLLDDHTRNMIYTFEDLTEERKKRILEILNKRALKNEIINLIELFKTL
jgi:hypothetical protein